MNYKPFDNRCADFGVNDFKRLIFDLRENRPIEISFEYINEFMNNYGLSKEILIAFDPCTDSKTASLEYYPGNYGITPKMYPTRAIGKILKYVSKNRLQILTRGKLKNALNIKWNKISASLLCLWYEGLIAPVPEAIGLFYVTENKQSNFSFFASPEYALGRKTP